jgi:hypothetical protein
VENRGQVDVIYLDFSKAFDSVSHAHLVKKLQTFGINGRLLKWFRSYLTNRMQKTMVHRSESNLTEVLSGVPQGSILGPLLFVLFINDRPCEVQIPSLVYLYADDAKVYRRVNSYNDCYELQGQLEALINWSKRWKMNFNPVKCKVMSITRKLVQHRFAYNVNGTNLERVTRMDDLGLCIQDNLMWDDHIRSIVAKANSTQFMIKRSIGHHAPFKAKLTLYTSLVRSKLEYGSVVWTPISKQNIKLLERVQRRASKYICGYRPLDYKQRLEMTKLEPLSYRREMLDCVFANKARSGILGDFAKEITTTRCTRHNRRLDIDRTWIQPRLTRSETYAHYYTNRLPYLWNELPPCIRRLEFIPKSTRFKSLVKQHYQTKTVNNFDPENTCTWTTHCRCPICRI